jgi:hypothetical protein
MSNNNSGNSPWIVPIVVAIIGVVGSIVVALIPKSPTTTTPQPTSTIGTISPMTSQPTSTIGTISPKPSRSNDPNTIIVDPIIITRQMSQSSLATQDFYAGKTIILRYDTKVDVNTIQSCYQEKRCVETKFEDDLTPKGYGHLTVRCVFPENYNPYLQGLNRELFSSQSIYLITLSGYLKEIKEASSSSRGDKHSSTSG